MKIANHKIKVKNDTFELTTECPMCSKAATLTLPQDHFQAYDEYNNGLKGVNDAFPALNPVEREFLMTGYCVKCQQLLFRNKLYSDRITIEKE